MDVGTQKHHFPLCLEEFGRRLISGLKRYRSKVALSVSDRQAAAEVSVRVQEAFACGYETATETRQAQEQAIASVEESIS